MKTITASITVTMRRLPADACEQFDKPLGTIEVMGSGNDRLAFFDTEEDASNWVHDWVEGLLFENVSIDIGEQS